MSEALRVGIAGYGLAGEVFLAAFVAAAGLRFAGIVTATPNRSTPGGGATFANADGRREIALEPGAYERFYAGVAAWLLDGAPAPVDPADSVAVLHVLDAARSSAATRSIIEMETT